MKVGESTAGIGWLKLCALLRVVLLEASKQKPFYESCIELGAQKQRAGPA